MAWRDWFDFPFIRHVFRHVSGTIITVFLLVIVGWFIRTLMAPGHVGEKAQQIDDYVLLGLFIILAIQLFVAVIKETWKQIKGGWNAVLAI